MVVIGFMFVNEHLFGSGYDFSAATQLRFEFISKNSFDVYRPTLIQLESLDTWFWFSSLLLDAFNIYLL